MSILYEIFVNMFYLISIFLGFWEFIKALAYGKLYLNGYYDNNKSIKLCLNFALSMTVALILILYPISKLYF